MIIAILNLSGNVGKSTIAVHCFAANRPGAKLISVESINSSDADTVEGIDVEEVEASNFRHIFKQMMMADDAILDVGASNMVVFMSELKKYRSALKEVDLLLVPVVPQEKQQRDTIGTLEWLNDMGVDKKSIRVVFNQYENNGIPVEQAFDQITGFLKSEKYPSSYFDTDAIILANEVFDRVKHTGKTVAQWAEDTTDWRAKRLEARADGDITGMEEAIDGQMNTDLARAAQENLRLAYSALIKK